MKPVIRKAFNIIGIGLTLLSLFFVVEKLRQYWTDINHEFISMNYDILILSVAFYTLLNMLLVTSWWRILRYFHVNIHFRNAYFVYSSTLLAKYIPGNIFQFAGRQIVGLKIGINGRVLAKSMLVEIILLITSGSILSLFYFSNNVFILSILLLFCAVSSIFLFKKNSLVLQILFFQMMFLFSVGMVFYWLLTKFSYDIPFIQAISAYSFAWLIGIVMPGAPAGIGIREAVIIQLLSNAVDEVSLLSVIILCRLISVLADVITFLTSLLCKPLQLKDSGQYYYED